MKMEVLFKNKTKYTKQVYNEYLQFHQNKFGIKYILSTLLLLILLIFCIVSNIIYSNYLTTLIIILSLLLFYYFRFVNPRKKIEKERNSKKIKKQQIFTFTFYKYFFTVSDGKNLEKIYYWKLYKAFETDSFFYLYIDKEHSFLLDKSSFVIGNTSEFLKFINKKIWFKII